MKKCAIPLMAALLATTALDASARDDYGIDTPGMIHVADLGVNMAVSGHSESNGKARIDAIGNLADKSRVTLEGKVESIQDSHNFTLNDGSGSLKVQMGENESIVLKKDNRVTVTGDIDKSASGTSVKARTVTVNKDIVQAVEDAVEGNTDMSFQGAKTYSIRNLPDQGLVKVSGTVTKVVNAKEFSMKDGTDTINVDIESGEVASLAKGAHVTVIGNVDKGVFGKDINATKIIVTN